MSNTPQHTVEEWVSLYTDELFSWAIHKVKHRSTAEDLVQETFLVAVEKQESFKGNSSPKTWLFAILNNKINDFYRQASKYQAVHSNNTFEDLFDEHGSWKNYQTIQWDEKQNVLDDPSFISVLNGCLDKLPFQWRSIVTLKFLEEKKAEVICQEMDIQPTNYWQIVHRAKVLMKKCIEQQWAF